MPPRSAGTVSVITKAPKRPPQRTLTVDYVEALRAYSELLYKGGLAPKGVGRPEAVAAIIEVGRDIGLPATQAIANIKVVGGRPSIYGDAALAMVRASGLMIDFAETFDGEGDEYSAVCRTHRAGAKEPRVSRFSVADAKRAKLWRKEGPWTEYPERMLMFRARGFNLRDEFGDVLCGLIFVEEAMDTPGAGVRVVESETVAADSAIAIAAGQPVVIGTTSPALADPTTRPATEPVQPKPITDGQLERLAELRAAVCASVGCQDDDERRAAWSEVLSPLGVTSARGLNTRQASRLIDQLAAMHDPFAGTGPTPDAVATT